ncbi:PBP1A family penicillin-binding protein [Candidatus Daviesbacteria bacterium]|nr:PBP1A family penicillin-binding protein [Candidatus Daviesbacteria bacterium]MBI4036914.1 PBP1A family penicillin-binding protein [Candidatus Daviesbacteria bacterium]
MSHGSWTARKDSKKIWKFKLLSKASSGMLIIVIGFLLLVFGTVIFFATQIPNPSDLSSRSIAQATKIYDKKGELLYDIYQDQNRTPVKLNEIPEHVKQATLSIEDKDFYKHSGFSIVGITRAVFDLITSRRIEGGGSTLTQQLVKNALLSGERTVTRKLKEFILAIQVERVYSKDQILEMYLNEIPYGGTAYGIEAAANLYFGKSAKDLDLSEASLLAGLPQRPSVYSPYGTRPELARVRQKEVLKRMVEDKYITEEQAKAAEQEVLTYRTGQSEQGFKSPHFVLYVKQKLIEQFGDRMVEGGGLRVTTTLDYELQKKAEEVVKKEVDNLVSAKVGNGAAVVLDPKTGQILAMVGSKDYFGDSRPENCIEGSSCTFEPNVNVAISPRQPGSATKPIAYTKALEKGYTAAQTYLDVKTEFPGGDQPAYNPVNYDGQFRGPVQMRYALGNSYNIPAVKNLAMVGVKDVMELGYRMGLTTWEPSEENVNSVGLSLVLGGREVRLLDLVASYAVFASGGKQYDPVSILKVTDSKGKTLFEYRETEGRKVLDEGIAFIISDILADNGARTAAFGSNSVLNVSGRTVAVKTGTTDQKRDNWAVGYTPSVVVGVWVGNNNNTEMSPTVASGVTGASPIWNKIMAAALAGKSNEPFKRPDNVVQVEVDGLMTGKPHGGSPTRKEYFIAGTEPKGESGSYQRQRVCKSNPHRLANDNEDNEEKDVVVLQENDPTGADKWQKGIDEWVVTAPNPILVGATRGCAGVPGFTAGTGGVIEIVNVGNGANVPRVFDVLARANSPAGVKKITWLVDGGQKSTQTAEPFALHVEFPQGDKGSHTITVTLEDNNGGTFSSSIGVTVAL